MIQGEEIYKIWTPEDSIWSLWVKPILFTANIQGEFEKGEWQKIDTSWAPPPSDNTAIIVDIRGRDSILTGLSLASRGYRPIPLYNSYPGPAAIVELNGIIHGLHEGAECLPSLKLHPDAPPAFLLDGSRMPGTAQPEPGKFDNRWQVLPQDFPSANFMTSHNIYKCLLFHHLTQPAEDLAHVLLRWQEAGISIISKDPDSTAPVEALQVSRPSKFKWLFYSALVAMGLRRSSAGGFGQVVPIPTQGGHYG